MRKYTSLRTLKWLRINLSPIDESNYKLWSRVTGRGFFKLGAENISLYEYDDYWKVITFTRGSAVSDFTVNIFPKVHVHRITYGL